VKFLIIIIPLIIIGLSYMMFKRDGDIKKLSISILLLLSVISLAIVGNIMRAITPLFLLHLLAIAFSFLGIIYYVLREKLVWFLLIAPVVTMILYLLFVWIGNEHLPSIF